MLLCTGCGGGPLDYSEVVGDYEYDRREMEFILGAIAIILVIGVAGFLLPSIIGIAIGISMIKAGNIIGGVVAIAVGILINFAMIYGSGIEGRSSSGYQDEECPYCGSGDTDGNHCYTCDDDF